MQDLIKVDKERLRIWIDRGVFGRDKVGIGSGRAGRQFTLAEALLARCLRELLDLTRTKGLLAEGPLLEDLRESVLSLLRPFPRIMRSSDQIEIKEAWLVLTWAGTEFRVSAIRGGEEPSYLIIRSKVGHPCAYIVLPVHEFCEEIQSYFERDIL